MQRRNEKQKLYSRIMHANEERTFEIDEMCIQTYTNIHIILLLLLVQLQHINIYIYTWMKHVHKCYDWCMEAEYSVLVFG